MIAARVTARIFSIVVVIIVLLHHSDRDGVALRLSRSAQQMLATGLQNGRHKRLSEWFVCVRNRSCPGRDGIAHATTHETRLQSGK